jgi:branched-chain amino acid transport system substrate-binding protein
MLFPQAAAGSAFLWTLMVGAAATFPGGTPIGFITCYEAQICRDGDRYWPDYARRNGLDPVYRGQISLGQPDYTAQCLSARGAGAEVVFLGMENNAARRVARSCAQQGYRPVFGLVAPDTPVASEPGLESALFPSEVFPFVARDTAASREFQAARARDAPGVPPSSYMAHAWVAGKLFEKAASRLAGRATSADVLAGLWDLKGDTLGGLTSPLTFVRNRPAPPQYCTWLMRVRKGAWTAPRGSAAVCKPR